MDSHQLNRTYVLLYHNIYSWTRGAAKNKMRLQTLTDGCDKLLEFISGSPGSDAVLHRLHSTAPLLLAELLYVQLAQESFGCFLLGSHNPLTFQINEVLHLPDYLHTGFSSIQMKFGCAWEKPKRNQTPESKQCSFV